MKQDPKPKPVEDDDDDIFEDDWGLDDDEEPEDRWRDVTGETEDKKDDTCPFTGADFPYVPGDPFW